jgi:hypothetical protein
MTKSADTRLPEPFTIPPKIHFVIGFTIDRELQEKIFMDAAGSGVSVMNMWSTYSYQLAQQCLSTLDPTKDQSKTSLGFDRHLDKLASKTLGKEVLLPKAEGGLEKMDGGWTDLQGQRHEKHYFYPTLVLLGHHCLERDTKKSIFIDSQKARAIADELKSFFKSSFVDVKYEAAKGVTPHKPYLVNFDATEPDQNV